MRHHRYLGMVLAALGSMALLIPFATGGQDRQQEMLLQQAIQKETVDGDLNAAIKLYRRIVENPGEDRTVTARALLQIGKCYEKLGSQEARKAYETLLKQYSDQHEIATEARTRLAALTKPSKSGRIRMHQVFASPTAPIGVTLSPDGRFALYTDWDSGGNVTIRNQATGETRRVTSYADGPNHFALNATMSPDGEQIAFAWYNNKPTYDLRVVGIEGGKPRILYADNNYEVYPASWSPDGLQIAVRRYMLKEAAKGGPLTTEIALINVADGSIRVLKSLENVYWPQIFYSDDGRYLVYDFPSDKDSGRHDISLLATDGSSEVPLVRHPANDVLLGRIPETRTLLFRSDRSGTYDLYGLHVSGDGPEGAPEPIKRAIGEIIPRGFVKDGSFYFAIYTRAGSLRVAPFDSKSGKIQFEAATTDRGSNMQPMWSPDGDYLAFTSEQHDPAGPGHPFRRLRIRNMKTGDIRGIAPHLLIGSLYCWAPDAHAIIVRGSDTERQDKYGIYQVDLSRGKSNLLFELEDGDIADALWTADRKAIVYSRNGVAVMHDLESNSEWELFRQAEGNIRTISVSPDGKILALGIPGSQNGPGKLLTIPISGGKARQLATLQAPQIILGNIAWTPDGKYLLFPVEESQNSNILYRVSAEGGKPEKLWESKDVIAGISIRPDGKQIALSSLTQASELWVMENLREWLAR